MKILYIIRGLPGAGKSTLARNISFAHYGNDSCHGDHWFEADHFFTDAAGRYTFDPKQVHFAHQWCQESVRKALASGDQGIVIVSNTFTRHKEMEPYLEMGAFYGYERRIITVQCELTDQELAGRNVHSVPYGIIQNMRARWEH